MIRRDVAWRQGGVWRPALAEVGSARTGAEVLTRKKQGFSSALPYLLKGELDTLYEVFLKNTELAQDGRLRQAGIDRLVDQHRKGEADHGIDYGCF